MFAMKEKRSLGWVVVLLLVLVPLPGCFVVGVAVGAGVVAVVTSEDTAHVDLHEKPAAVFQAAVHRVESTGTVTFTNPEKTKLEGKIGGSSVTITVFVVGNVTRCQVKARKLAGTLPNLDLAKKLATGVSRSFPRPSPEPKAKAPAKAPAKG